MVQLQNLGLNIPATQHPSNGSVFLTYLDNSTTVWSRSDPSRLGNTRKNLATDRDLNLEMLGAPNMST